MRGFITTIAAAALLCALLELLLQNNGQKNALRFAIGLLFMALMVNAVAMLTNTPLPDWRAERETPYQQSPEADQEQMISELYRQQMERLAQQERNGYE